MMRVCLFLHPWRPRVAGLAHAALTAGLLVAYNLAVADDSEAVRAESPYFFVDSADPATDRLPLKATRVDVHISGVIAHVTVTQHYRNEGRRPLEARYVFPGSTQAAVHGLTVRLGGRVLTARIRERQQARIDYEAAKREGKTAALLEQQRPNVFAMNVAHILPGDDVAVELQYTELLTPTDSEYGFVFPTVVGPRYNSPAGAAAREDWVSMPVLPAGEAPVSAFDLRVALDAPVPVQAVSSGSHALAVSGTGTGHARIALAASDRPANNRDFILNYRLAGDRIQSGLMLMQGASENYFLALVEPPKAVPVNRITPREYIFVVDVSGSMAGYPLETTKTLLRELIGGLRPSDTFNVMLFSSSSRMLSPRAVPATAANIRRALATIDSTDGGGSTEIVPALKAITALPKPADLSRSVIIVTDGYVTVENDVFRLIRANLDRANVFAFGIGSSVNRHLIEGIARAGQGEPFIVTRPEQAAAQAERLRRMIEAPVLTGLSARMEGIEAYDVEPAHLPDLLGGRPVVLYGKWRPKAGTTGPARLIVTGQGAGGPFRAEVEADSGTATSDPALRYLWARQRIGALSDQEALEGGEALKPEITRLGLAYNLLTQYTSFVAVDQVVRNAGADLDTVKQPQALPEGVANSAVGVEVPGTPEPSLWLALLVTLGVWLAVLRTGRRRAGVLP